jgi:hypothetical protein
MRNELGRNFSERYRFGAPNPNMGVGEAPRTPPSVLGTLPAMAILLTVAQYSTAFAEHSVPRPEIAPGELKFHALGRKKTQGQRTREQFDIDCPLFFPSSPTYVLSRADSSYGAY